MTHEARSEKREWESLDRYCFRDSSNDATETHGCCSRRDRSENDVALRIARKKERGRGKGKRFLVYSKIGEERIDAIHAACLSEGERAYDGG